MLYEIEENLAGHFVILAGHLVGHPQLSGEK
jgi:hypothetical protein